MQKRKSDGQQQSDLTRTENKADEESNRLNRSNAHRSPKLPRMAVIDNDPDEPIESWKNSEELLEDDREQHLFSRLRQNTLNPASSNFNGEKSSKSATSSGGVGKAMIRRLTGIMTNSVKQVDFDDLDGTKVRSFHKRRMFFRFPFSCLPR